MKDDQDIELRKRVVICLSTLHGLLLQSWRRAMDLPPVIFTWTGAAPEEAEVVYDGWLLMLWTAPP